MMFPKVLPARSKKYMEWISKQPCCLTGMEPHDYQSVDPHHEPVEGAGTMGGKPCDSRCVPVAHYLHCEMEDVNGSRRGVWERYGVDPEQVISAMQTEWLRQGGKKFWS